MRTQSAQRVWHWLFGPVLAAVDHHHKHIAQRLQAQENARLWQRIRESDVQPVAVAHIALIDGIAGAPPWPGPSGTWSAVYTHRQPHRRRETGVLIPHRPRPVTFLATPCQSRRPTTENLFLLDAVDMQPDLDEDPDATIEHPKTRSNKLFQQAIAGLRESEKYDANN